MCTVHNWDVPALFLIQFNHIWFGEPRIRLATKIKSNSGFNLLQISPNWFLRNWTRDPRLKWALVIICQRKKVSCKGYTASVAHHWTLAVYDQLSLKSMEIPYILVLYNQLKTDHLALIPFNLGAKGYKANVAHPWAVAVYHQFSLKSMEIPYVSVLYN